MPALRSLSTFNHRKGTLWLVGLWLLILAPFCLANSSLLFKEAQLVLGPELGPNMSMQQTGIGIDYLQRLSDDFGDRALLAFQGRLNWNSPDNRTVFDLYNTYIKLKNPFADWWIGHSRIAYGLNFYFDSHALLLAPLSMTDFGFENDWGTGLTHDTDWGTIAISASLGSGMPLQAEGNHLTSGRISYGLLNRNNFNLGISQAIGSLINNNQVNLLGFDAALLYENYELRAERSTGSKGNLPYHSLFVRGGIKLLDEDRLKVELQRVEQDQGSTFDQISSLGISYLFDENLTFRLMAQTDTMSNDTKFVFQTYFYAPWQ
ncbi:MAG: hypothetical protein WC890_06495 [Candidatus Margulisiibacteriota bacterium]